uniref:CRAL-TRIO domain-containing protein n=1 Tax=Aplanochytrium stocchinoi TaxID=215587 RepID=A0A7S3V239_9STRA
MGDTLETNISDKNFADEVIPTLKPEHVAALEEFRKLASGKSCKEIEQKIGSFTLSDATLLRFLQQRLFNVEKAEKLLDKHLDWRDKYMPSTLTVSDIEAPLKSGIVRRAGLSKERTPIVFIDVENFHPKKLYSDHDDFVKLCAFFFEYNIRLLQPGVYHGVIIFDLKGYSYKEHGNKLSLFLVQILIQIVQEQYPQRMRKIYITNAPYLFNMLWNIIKVWMEKDLKEKIVIVKNMETLKELIDEDVLEERFGGRRSEPYPIDGVDIPLE